ncbi:MAG: nuclear transport factor 2 family protein [Gemmatimonadaceae bacterium]
MNSFNRIVRASNRHSKRMLLTSARLALIAVATACTTEKPVKQVSDRQSLSAAGEAAIRDSVKAVLGEFTSKMSKKDFDGAGRLYSDDSSFSWVENGSLGFQNAKDVRASLKTLSNIPEIKLSYYETQISVLAPKVATVRTEFSQTFSDKPGRGTTYGGFLTMTMVREKDGWKILNGHTSSRKPRPGL